MAQSTTPMKGRVTHIEIRRVQNGFVVMGFDFARGGAGPDDKAVRVSYVATDMEGLKSTIENLINAVDVEWVPTVDLPIIDMVKR